MNNEKDLNDYSSRTKCDMCGSLIKDGLCKCGIWKKQNEVPFSEFKSALERFHEMRKMAVSSEEPSLGCAAIYFRGDYNDCVAVTRFIYSLKGRSFYSD